MTFLIIVFRPKNTQTNYYASSTTNFYLLWHFQILTVDGLFHICNNQSIIDSWITLYFFWTSECDCCVLTFLYAVEACCKSESSLCLFLRGTCYKSYTQWANAYLEFNQLHLKIDFKLGNSTRQTCSW